MKFGLAVCLLALVCAAAGQKVLNITNDDPSVFISTSLVEYVRIANNELGIGRIIADQAHVAALGNPRILSFIEFIPVRDNSTNINFEGAATTDIGLLIQYESLDAYLRRNRFLRFGPSDQNADVVRQMLFQPFADFGSCKLCSKSTEWAGFTLNYRKHVIGIFQHRQSAAKFPLAGWFARSLAGAQAEIEALDIRYAHRVGRRCR